MRRALVTTPASDSTPNRHEQQQDRTQDQRGGRLAKTCAGHEGENRTAAISSAHFVEHPMPSRSRTEVNQRVSQPADSRAERFVLRHLVIGIERPVNRDGRAHDRVAIHETPIAAVPTAIAIVSHREILIRRHHQLVPRNVLQDLIGPLGAHQPPNEIRQRPAENCRRRDRRARRDRGRRKARQEAFRLRKPVGPRS